MSTKLLAQLEFNAVGPGANATLPHGLNLSNNGVLAIIPDIVAFDNPDFDFVSCTDTDLTVVNNGAGAGSTRCYLIWFHSIQRAMGQAMNVALFQQFSNPPFVIRGAGGGGGGGATDQVFTYVCTGAEGSDFFIPLPAARADDNYVPQVTCGGVSEVTVADHPDLVALDRTTLQFRVITTADVQLGDRLDVTVQQRT